MRSLELSVGVLSRQWPLFTLVVLGTAALVGGWIGAPFGVYNLFHDEPMIRAAMSLEALRRSSVLTTYAFLAIFAGFIFLFDYNRSLESSRIKAADSFYCIYGAYLPLAFLPLIATWLPGVKPDLALTTPEQIRAAMGTAIGAVTLAPAVYLHGVRNLGGQGDRLGCLARLIALPAWRNAMLILLLTGVAAFFVPEYASSSLLHLAAILLVLYMALAMARPLRPALLVAILVAGVGVEFKNIVPRLDYANPVDVSQPVGVSGPALVSPSLALDAWLAARQTGLAKPKLIILAVSGGGYAATFWTAAVIDQLRALAPGMLDDVRLVTGASGGMVATAYLISQKLNPISEETNSTVAAIVADISKSPVNAATDLARGYPGASIDSLSAVARQMVPHDLLSVISPVRPTVDRGAMLDAQWTSLRIPFARLLKAELAGKIPSIVLTPVIVETGEPLVISNLDLDGDRGGPRRAGETSPSVGQSPHLFRWLPAAQHELELGTAVRLNASFPFVLPAAELPTRPRRRLMDAGFFDNYGIVFAAEYLALDPVRQWIKDKSSGIALVQVKAFPNQARTTRHEATDCQGSPETSAGWFLRLSGGLNWFTAPFETLLSVREAGMVARNEQLLRRLRLEYDHPTPIEIFSFENPSATSMSWFLTQTELACLQRDWPPESANRNEVERLKAFLK